MLTTAAALYNLDNSGFIEFGGELIKAGEKTPFVEIDILWLAGSCFVIAECKDYKDIDKDTSTNTRQTGDKENESETSKKNNKEKKLKTIQDSFQRTIEAAKIIGAKIVLLGITTNGDYTPFNTLVKKFVEDNRNTDLGIHLVLNGTIFPFGAEEALGTHIHDINALRPIGRKQKLPKTLGDPIYDVQGGSLYGIYKKEIFEQWEEYLKNKDTVGSSKISEGNSNSSNEIF